MAFSITHDDFRTYSVPTTTTTTEGIYNFSFGEPLTFKTTTTTTTTEGIYNF